MISCVVVTPQTLVSYGIMATLDTIADMGVVGVAKSLADLQDLAGSADVDVIILDPQTLTDKAEPAAMHALNDVLGERTRILVLRDGDEVSPTRHILIRYASSCVSLQDSSNVLIQAIRQAHQGAPGECLCMCSQNREHETLCDPRPPHLRLSPREREVMLLISENVPLKEIARRLEVSLSSVHSYRTRIFAKMHLRSNTAMTRYALQYRLIA